jgi:hypothetical protein
VVAPTLLSVIFVYVHYLSCLSCIWSLWCRFTFDGICVDLTWCRCIDVYQYIVITVLYKSTLLLDEGFSLCFGVRIGVDLSFISVFIYLHIIQKPTRKFMSHRNICVCLHVCSCTSPCSRYVSHTGIKGTTSSIQVSALFVLSQFPFILSGPHSVPFNRRLITETGASFLFIPHFISHCSISDRKRWNVCISESLLARVWSNQVGPKLAIVVYLFKKLKKKA